VADVPIVRMEPLEGEPARARPDAAGGRRPAQALAAVFALAALSELAWLLWGQQGQRPGLEGVLAAALVFLASGCLLLAGRVTTAGLSMAAAAGGLVLCVTIALRALPAGQITTGVILLLLAVVVSTFQRGWWLVAQVGGYCAAFTVAVAINPVDLLPLFIAVYLASMVSICTIAFLSSGQERALREVERLADHDALTGVLNRRGTLSRAASLRALAERSGRPTAVIAIDLDDFKAVNDARGHQAGDALLADLALAWGSVVRAGDVLGRTGGDEFVVVAPFTDLEGARRLTARMRQAYAYPWTAGIAIWQAAESFDSVLRRADREMYRRKRGPGGRPAS